MDARQERGLLIAATCKIEMNRLGWKVPSQSGNGDYIVNLDHGEPDCDGLAKIFARRAGR